MDMKWLLLLLPLPAIAGDLSIIADTWANDREPGFGIEYTLDGEWQPSISVARYKNDFDDASWYGGIGISRSLPIGEWDLSAGLHALYFKHSGEETLFFPASGESYVEDGNVIVPADTTVIYRYARNEYLAPSPSLTLSYQRVGMTVSAIQLPNEDWSTGIGIRFTF